MSICGNPYEKIIINSTLLIDYARYKKILPTNKKIWEHFDNEEFAKDVASHLNIIRHKNDFWYYSYDKFYCYFSFNSKIIYSFEYMSLPQIYNNLSCI